MICLGICILWDSIHGGGGVVPAAAGGGVVLHPVPAVLGASTPSTPNTPGISGTVAITRNQYQY